MDSANLLAQFNRLLALASANPAILEFVSSVAHYVFIIVMAWIIGKALYACVWFVKKHSEKYTCKPCRDTMINEVKEVTAAITRNTTILEAIQAREEGR